MPRTRPEEVSELESAVNIKKKKKSGLIMPYFFTSSSSRVPGWPMY